MIERRAGLRNDAAFSLAILYTIGFFGFLFLMMLRDVPASNGDMINQLIPVLSMIQGGIIQYFYQKAAAATAEKKDETIKTLANTAAVVASTGVPPVSIPAKAETMHVAAEQVTEEKK